MEIYIQYDLCQLYPFVQICMALEQVLLYHSMYTVFENIQKDVMQYHLNLIQRVFYFA